MFDKRVFRPLSRTLVVETLVNEVTANVRNTLLKQSCSVGVPVDGAFSRFSTGITSKGFLLKATEGFLSIETPTPIVVQIGSTQFIITGQFTIAGTFPQAILVSREDVLVNIVQY